MSDENPLGKWLREMRQARGLPLRVVAAAAEMDTAQLSKIELGQRHQLARQFPGPVGTVSIPEHAVVLTEAQ